MSEGPNSLLLSVIHGEVQKARVEGESPSADDEACTPQGGQRAWMLKYAVELQARLIRILLLVSSGK